ncbi:MAG TPA: prepilin peptidase [Polyangia bacterium]|nr:prepilin peptidase [Polyangia bacterium]
MDDTAALLSSPLATAMAAVFGAVWGSFCNVVIARVPRRESIVRPASRCPSCGTPIRAADNVPILSYLWLRGRCRACGAAISARYPLVEALAALLAAAIWWKFVAADPGEAAGVRVARFACYFAFAAVMLVLSFIDLATRLLPDAITLPALAVLYLAGFGAHGADWLDRLIGAAAGYLVFRLIADFYYYVLKREGLGLGDGKLLAVVGAVLGWKALPFVVFGAAFTGAVVSLPVALIARRRAPSAEPLRHLQIPFGPFLAAAAVAYLFAGSWLQGWLESAAG